MGVICGKLSDLLHWIAPMTEPNMIPYDQDEISISELLTKLWAKRGLIVFLPLVLAGLTIVWLLASKTASPQHDVLSYYLEFNGIGIRNSVADGNDAMMAIITMSQWQSVTPMAWCSPRRM
jgi:hypothetical protein